MKTLFSQFLLFAVIAIPMDQKSAWTELQFKKINPNIVSYDKNGMTIEVNSSASPLIYGFGSIQQITEIQAEIAIEGKMNATSSQTEFEEDSYFRLGVVAEGKNTLGAMGSMFAPDWVKKMFALAPKESGLDKIYFYNVALRPELLGKSREHPRSKYMHEEYVSVFDPTAKTMFVGKKFDPPIAAAGIWLSMDGDETQSKFKIGIKDLHYTKK